MTIFIINNQKKNEASLSLPSVQEAIENGKPLIAEFESRVEIKPAAGLPPV